VKYAGEVDFDPLQYFDKKDVKRLDRFTQFALVAAREAIEAAQVKGCRSIHGGSGFRIWHGWSGVLGKPNSELYTKGQRTVSPSLFQLPSLT